MIGRSFKIASLRRLASLNKLPKALFSSGHDHHSGSDSDHHHGHDHHAHKPSFFEDKNIKEPWNIFKHSKPESSEILKLIEKLREPIKSSPNHTAKVEGTNKTPFEIEKEYSEFLASAFEKLTLKKYPEYKLHLEQFKHKIANYDNLNSYEREVKTLDAYMFWTVEELRRKSFEALKIGDNKSKIEAAKARKEFFDRITSIEDSDTNVLKGIKTKLKKLIDSELKYQSFKHNYTKELETKALEKIITEKKVAYSNLDFTNNTKLENLKAPLNPHHHEVSITPHDHINITKWNSQANKIENEKYKYLALYDLTIDQFLRHARPNNQEDDPFKYTNPNHRPDQEFYDEYADNTVFDYTCRLDGEFYVKLRQEINEFMNKSPAETEDPVSILS